MASRSRRGGTRIEPGLLLPAVGLVVIALAGFGLIASSMGWLDAPEAERRVAPPGSVAVPVAARPIAAYQALTLEDLLDPRGELAVIHLPEESVLDETFTDARLLLGRVLARDKEPGRVFRDPDFLPEGTRPGIVAGIPAGKVALRIEATKVTGSVGLRRGDRFDLVATWRANARNGVQRPYAGQGMQAPRAEVVQVALDAAVVTPLEERRLPGPAGRPGAIVEEMVIAVAPDEVALVTEALELAARIDCVPRSGRPMTQDALDTAVSESASRVGSGSLGRSRQIVVETIQGGERTLLEVPGASPIPIFEQAPAVSAGPRPGPGT